MKYAEENHAKELYSSLVIACAHLPHDTEVTVHGAGVHWQCTVLCGVRSCTIHCFYLHEPEYLVYFQENANEKAAGRTSSIQETIEAVTCLLEGAERVELHERFAFVDAVQRSLKAIEAAVIAHYPELDPQVTHELCPLASDLYELWFRGGDRSCRISYYGKNPLPDCIFHWDQCELFRFQTENHRQLGMVLKRWLTDHAMPSEIRAEFPWIEMRLVANYYEQGNPIEGEFIESWNRMEQFYQDPRFPQSAPVLAFLTEARRAGYDRTLRAGQSLYTLVVSRSRRHGLRRDQPYIAISFARGVMEVTIHIDGKEQFNLPQIEFTPHIHALFDRLVAQKIN